VNAGPRDDDASLPPHDIAAERAVLGAMMLDADALAACLAMLTGQAFFRPAHQLVLAAISALAESGEPVDWLMVKAELERRGDLGRVGGPLATSDLIDATPSAAQGPWYARRLLELQSQRDAGVLGIRIQAAGADPSLTAAERLDIISGLIDGLADTAVRAECATAADLIGPLIEALEAGPSAACGIPSGWGELDRIIPGFRPGEVTVIGGRPSMGKSVVLLNIAAYAAIRLRENVLAVTLEMSAGDYMERLLAAEAGIELGHIRERALTDDDWDRIAKARIALADADTLRIHEGPDLSAQGIRAELRAMRRSGKPAALVTVDYLQLMEGSGQRESRQLEVSGMSRALKLISREFGVPVLVGSQLNRGPEMRSDHRPVKADLRESGAVENDADIVILLYRDDEYVEDSPRAGEIDLIVAKNRQGARATATLAFRGHLARCSNLYRDPEPAREWTPTSALEETQ
jgi:replicative DNA helicase